MTLAVVLKLIHVVTAIWLIVGVVGRNLILSRVGQIKDIRTVRTVLSISNVFERRMVIPGSMAVLLAGVVTALGEGWPIFGFLQGGRSNWVFVALLLYLSTIPLVPLIYLPHGKVFDAALAEASAQEQVTPALTAAFQDRTVWAARSYETGIIAIVLALMVLKPF